MFAFGLSGREYSLKGMLGPNSASGKSLVILDTARHLARINFNTINVLSEVHCRL
jgi:hypothetical protein